MLAKNCTMQDLESALESVNKKFDGNIKFKDAKPAGKHIRFTLSVNNSRGKGGRLSVPHFDGKQKRVCAACWHAHGEFFDALPADAVIVANGAKIRPGDDWQDRNVGSQYRPAFYSELCECN